MDIVRGLAIFCEDIREEKSGQDTLIGIMADNLVVPVIPVVASKISVYVRVYFENDAPPEPVSLMVHLPSGEKVDMGAADISLVEFSLTEAKSRNNELAGLILKGVMSPVPLKAAGPISAIIKIGNNEIVLGTLNIVIDPAASVSPPPS